MGHRRIAKMVATLGLVVVAGGIGASLLDNPNQPAAAAAGASTETGSTQAASIVATPVISPLPAAQAKSPSTTLVAQPATPVVRPAAAVPTPKASPLELPTAAVHVSAATPQLAAIGTSAMALLRNPIAGLGYTLEFQGPMSGYLGLTNCSSKQIDVYVEASQTVQQVAYITAFEMAHAVDCVHNTTARRAAWQAIRGSSGTWFPSCACSENAFGSGDFSDAFATWQVGHVYGWRSDVAAPGPSQMQALVPYLEGL
jgi:hypothetical protein